MLENCSRCNNKVEKTELANRLCKRCQDVLEFGYQSFPAYRLKEQRQILAQLNLAEPKLALK